MITELNERSRTVFRFIVDTYLSTGTPVGSRTISKLAGLDLSPASIRNTMADLEETGLLYAPHTSAGRMPTDQGLRLYIDGIMQVGNISAEDRKKIQSTCGRLGRPMDDVLEQTTSVLSGLSSCASLVIAPKISGTIRQVQFVQLRPGKILAILVFDTGLVENRVINVDGELPQNALISASNYLTEKLSGKTIDEAEQNIKSEIKERQTKLDEIASRLVEKGLAISSPQKTEGRIIIRGQSHLLEDLKAIEDLESARSLLSALEKQNSMLDLLGHVDSAEGVQIFIGAENKIFNQSGWSMIISPYKNAEEQIVGAIGVIGPTRLDYDRIIPMVDYTSRIVSKLVDDY